MGRNGECRPFDVMARRRKQRHCNKQRTTVAPHATFKPGRRHRYGRQERLGGAILRPRGLLRRHSIAAGRKSASDRWGLPVRVGSGLFSNGRRVAEKAIAERFRRVQLPFRQKRCGYEVLRGTDSP